MQSVDLGNGYTIALWHAGKAGDLTAKPVVQLTHNGVSVQWLLLSHGFGASGSLSCATQAPVPNCVVTDPAGVHSAAAQALVLRNGRMVAPGSAYVVADLPTIAARDLNGDGYLDVVAVDSDYTPNFAQGHLYWHTFRFADDRMVSTGCEARTSTTAPTRLVSGRCPRL